MIERRAAEECIKAATWWNHLANQEVERAAYYQSRGEYAGVPLNKAQLYRKVVVTLLMEAEDGISRCSCCCLPYSAHPPTKSGYQDLGNWEKVIGRGFVHAA